MAPEDTLAFDVERGRPEALRDGRNFGWGDEQEHGPRIDEAADQPGTGDPVDLGARSGHPNSPS